MRNSVILCLCFIILVSATFTEEQLQQIDQKADKKYTWLKKSLQKKAKAFDTHDFVKEYRKEVEKQKAIKEAANKYAAEKNMKIAAKRAEDLKYYYPYLVGESSDSSSGSSQDIPIYLDDNSFYGAFWNLFGYSNHIPLDPNSDLTSYYIKSKNSEVKMDKQGNLYLAVNKY